MNTRVPGLLGVLVILISASSSLATPDPADSLALSNAIADVENGKHILIRTDVGQELEGYWHGSDTDSIFLQQKDTTQPLSVAQADVLGIWVRGRATHAGAKALGIAVAAVGGGYGILAGIYLSSISGEDTGAVIPKIALVGLLFAAGGGVIGAATGSAIGAALPRWHLVYSHDPDPAASSTTTESDPSTYPTGTQRIARFNLVGGYVRGLEKGAQGSPGVRGALLIDLSRHLTVGPELGYAATGYHKVNSGPGYSEVTSINNTVHAGSVLYYIPFRAVVSPYLAAGIGLYVRDDQYLGYSLGGGLEVNGKGNGPRFSLDFRYHDGTTPQPGTAEIEGQWPAFITAGVGISF